MVVRHMFDIIFATKFGLLMWMVGEFGELLQDTCPMCEPQTTKSCVPNHGALLAWMPGQFMFWSQAIWCRENGPTN